MRDGSRFDLINCTFLIWSSFFKIAHGTWNGQLFFLVL
jgi:hypothetical protein